MLHPIYPQLVDAFIGDCAAVWAYARHVHAKETPYAFVLYGVEGPTQLGAYVLTDEGLTRSAQEYVDRGDHKTIEEAREALRWSVPDAPPPQSESEFMLPAVDQLFEPHAEELGEVKGYTLLAEAGMEALEVLDKQGLFGAGPARQNLLLVVLVEGTAVEFMDVSVKRLNSPTAYEKFRASGQVEGEFARCDALAASRGGGSIYLAGRRTDVLSDEERREIVAFAVRNGQLARRWTYTSRSRDDTVREIVVTPDGAWVYILRNTSRKGREHSTVMRFGRGSNSPVAQQDIPFMAGAIAVSHDGARIAVAGDKRTIHLLDASLSPIRDRVIDVQPFGVRFLRSGELLIASETKLLRLDPMTDGPAGGSANVPSWRLSIDEAERVAAVSPFPSAGVPKDRQRSQVITLLSLPTLEPLRSIGLSGRDLGRAVISPDGRLVACADAAAGSYRGPLAVFDAATGREVARHEVEVADLAFLRDGRTVAIAKNGITTGEAVELFLVPSPLAQRFQSKA
jgi:hypothetical protein